MLACDISGKRLAALEERAGPARAGAAVGAEGRCRRRERGGHSRRQAAIERFGTIHGLANVAGGIAGIGEDLIDRPIDRITFDDSTDRATQLDSAFLMTRALVPHFRENRYGKVVNVASLAAFGNFEHMGNAGYDAAKAAVVGLTQTLSRSLGPRRHPRQRGRAGLDLHRAREAGLQRRIPRRPDRADSVAADAGSERRRRPDRFLFTRSRTRSAARW